MRTKEQIAELLDQLEYVTADALECQDLDFKEWPGRSLADGAKLVLDIAICLSNGGGGDAVLGVRDNAIGRQKAIVGVPLQVSIDLLQKTVHEKTEPKIMPTFAELAVPEGTGRLILMSVVRSVPYATDAAGGAKIRVGKECLPLTGSIRHSATVHQAFVDLTAELVGKPADLISPAAMERLRDVAIAEQTPRELLQMTDVDLLGSLGVIREGKLTRAGLLLAGKEAAVRQHLPNYVVSFFRMTGDVAYTDQSHGSEAIPIALRRLEEKISAENPITTVQLPLFHLEYRTYPELALREALTNAFCHADFAVSSPILVKQYRNKLEISNPGGFVGGISPDNILHHPPTARNPHLVDAMIRLRLINRANLGV